MTRSWPLAAIVIDASALIELLLQSDRASAVVQTITGADMMAPDLINVEVLSTLRRLEQAGALTASRAVQAISDLQVAPVRRYPTFALLGGIWALHYNLSAYDACYVALARALGCSLVTADARLSRAPDPGVRIHVV